MEIFMAIILKDNENKQLDS